MPNKRARRHFSQLSEFERPDHRVENCSLVDAPCCWPGGSLGVCRPFVNGLPGAIFQQDNALPHTARVAQDFLRHFQTLPWPSRSPDLSPVEHVWDLLKRQMPSCYSVHDLPAVQDLWAHLPQDNIRCLINSMPARVAACIAAGGGPTRY
ncbi:transposable element Tcb2 transposase [Trichonephila clavipes]|nr:transposable element Tcb2 transposase [Trichonephila clavipes]